MKKIALTLMMIILGVVLVGCNNTPSNEEDKVIDYIQVDSSSLRESYDLESFSIQDIEIFVYFTDNTYEKVEVSENMISSSDLANLYVEGEHTIEILYGGNKIAVTIVFTNSVEVNETFTLRLSAIYETGIASGGITPDMTYEEWLESIRGPQGISGKEVLFQVAEGFIQWQYSGDTLWTNLVSLSTLTGASGTDGVDGSNGTDGIDGTNGKEVLFQVADGFIQWQYSGDTLWTNLVSLSTLTGASGTDGVDGSNGTDGVDGISGKEVLFQVAEGFIQWQYNGDTLWTNLVSLSTLTGASGTDGVDGSNGTDGIDGTNGKEVLFQVAEGFIQWQYNGDTLWTNLVSLSTLTGASGTDGVDGSNGTDGVDGTNGKEVLFQVAEGFIQWQYSGDTLWTNLVSLSTLTGASGTDGVDGSNGTDGVDGTNGKEVLFQVAEGFIQWQYSGDTLWANLISLDTITGSNGVDGSDGENGIDGREVIFQVTSSYIQWKYSGDESWTNLIALSMITGDSGEKGENGLTPYIGENGNWWIGEEDTLVFAGYTGNTIPQTGDFVYSVNTDGESYYLVSYTGTDRYISIPKYYNGFPVTSIGSGAFKNNVTLEAVYISNLVGSIEDEAFMGNTNLQTIEFEEGSSLEAIGASAFYNNVNLQSLSIPDGVLHIGEYAFKGAVELTDVVVPDSVLDIGASAFSGLKSLNSISIPFVGGSRDATLTEGLFGYIFGTAAYTGGVSTKQYYSGSLYTYYYLPSLLSEVSITDAVNISFGAFYDASMVTNIYINKDVLSIGDKAFYNLVSLSSVVIEEDSSLQSIGEKAFYYTSSLTVFSLPQTVTSIGTFAFYRTGITEMYLSNNLITIEDNAFHSANAVTLFVEATELPASWSSIWNPSDRPVVWGVTDFVSLQGIDYVLYSDFTAGVLKQTTSSTDQVINISSSINGYEVKVILANAFKSNQIIEEVYLPNTITSIESYAFYENVNLTSITFETNSQLTTIGTYAFANSSSLESLVIPQTVNTIGSYAFMGTSSLATITFEDNSALTEVGSYVFYDAIGLTTIDLPTTVSTIGEYAFSGTTSLVSIVLHEGLTMIDSYAFTNSGLMSITIPNTVTRIETYVFYNALALNTIEFGEDSQLTTINDGAFYGATSLNAIVIPKTVSYIGEYVFRDTLSLTSIVFSEGSIITELGYLSFTLASALSSIDIPEGVTTIGESAFYGCSSLTTVSLPGTLTTIGENSFKNVSSITSIVIPDSVEYISFGAFSGASSLQSITIPFVGDAIDAVGDNGYFGYIFGSTSYTNSYVVGYRSTYTSSGFYLPIGLTTVTITKAVSIPNLAFYETTYIQTIVLPNTLNSIGNYAFDYTPALSNINIPPSVTSIDYYAFAHSGLTTIYIPYSVTVIGNSAFYASSDLVISVEVASKPLTWDDEWNINALPVIWGVSN